MNIIFPAFNEPFPKRKVLVRIPDEIEANGYAPLLAVQINTNIAVGIHDGSLELLRVQETELEDIVDWVASTPPLASGVHEGLFWGKVCSDMRTR